MRVGDLFDDVVGELEIELQGPILDGVPAGEAVGDVDVAAEAEVLRVEDLVRRGVVEHRLGVDPGLVGEGGVAGDVVVEGHVDP